MSDSEGDAAPVVCAIAHPLADAKLAKKVLKVVKKGAAAAGESRACRAVGLASRFASRRSLEGEVRTSRRERGGQSAAQAASWVRCKLHAAWVVLAL